MMTHQSSPIFVGGACHEAGHSGVHHLSITQFLSDSNSKDKQTWPLQIQNLLSVKYLGQEVPAQTAFENCHLGAGGMAQGYIISYSCRGSGFSS